MLAFGSSRMCPFILNVQVEDMMAVPFSNLLVYAYVNDIAPLTGSMLAPDFHCWLRWIVKTNELCVRLEDRFIVPLL